MTELCFDGVSSARWGSRPKKSQNVSLRAGIIGVGVAVSLSWTVSAIVHFSSLSFTSSSTSSGDFSQALSPKSRVRQDRASLQPTDNGRGSMAASRGDRLGFHIASIDKRSLSQQTSQLSAIPMGKSARFLFSPEPLPSSEFNERFLPPGKLVAYGDGFRPVTVAGGARSTSLAGAAATAKAQVDARIAPPPLASRGAMRLASLGLPHDTATAIDKLAQSVPVPTSPRPFVEEPAAVAAAGRFGALPKIVPEPTAPQPAERQPASSQPASSQPAAKQTIVTSLPEVVPLPDARPHRAPVDVPSNRASQPTFAYAKPETPEDHRGGLLASLFGHRPKLPGPGSGIAVYDIREATVYLPDGERLEAHSGLGRMRDNPHFVAAKDRGPTPPNVYNLVMRERRFHGVEAVRLLPVDGDNKYGRVGLLAHTYMYRGGGGPAQSNGCIVFKDYHRFLTAFKQGKIRQIIVVPNLSALPTYMASL